METSLWLLLVLFVLWRWYSRMHASGKVTLAPGDGYLRVPLPFHAKHVDLEFVGCNPVPGCSRLEDVAVVTLIECDSFTIRYSIKSGVRILKWRACA
jgi:hypothetical protein